MNEVSPFVSEFIATMFLLFFGNGIGMAIKLKKHFNPNSDARGITCFAWGIAVMFGGYIGYATNGMMNPIITLSQLFATEISIHTACICIAAQFLGAFIGSLLAYAMYQQDFHEHVAQEIKLTVFATSLAKETKLASFSALAISSFAFIFTLTVFTHMPDRLPQQFMPVITGVLVSLIGLSAGSSEGYPVNPARDWGPRFAHWILPIPNKGSSQWGYAWITLCAPVLGTFIAFLLYQGLFY